MVTRRWTASLMQLTANLAYLRESSARTLTAPTQLVPVKGPNFILATLRQGHQTVLLISTSNPSLQPLAQMAQEMGNWVAALDRKYGEQMIWFQAPYHLDSRDAQDLARDSQRWIQTIIDTYSESGTVSIDEEAASKLLSPAFMEKLDPITREDLSDGVSCILHNLPTPGAMILLRVAENAVRKYSSNLTGRAVEKESWGELLDELEGSGKVGKSMLGYLQYLKGARNEAQHPDRRFTQEESERVLIQVKGLLDELARVGLVQVGAK